METVHGKIQTPVFMNVGTCATVKGGISTMDLKEVNCQVELSNTYHLHIRPGDDLIYRQGGLHKFFNWDRPVLTDSGGFQVFSLAKLRRIKEEGVYFNSHVDGRRIFMGPEESMQIQSHLGSTIAMAFDECIENPAEYKYTKQSCERTYRWLVRCKNEMARLNSLPDTVNPHQMLFGINQGSTYADLRIAHMQKIAELDLDGYAIGGLAVGETAEEMKQNLKMGARYSQLLLLPIPIPMTAEEYAAVVEYQDEIEKAGFRFYGDEGYIVQINEIPGGISESAAVELFSQIAVGLANGTASVELSREIEFEKALYHASCKAAVKGGRQDGPEHLDFICKKLFSNPDIRYCPHGRPVAFELTKSGIEHQFKRS